MFQVIEQVVGNAVVSSGISYEALCTILIGALFAIMIVGLVAGQELAFVLGGAGIIIGVIAWGGSGVNIAATKIYDQMQSYSMVAIPMFVLMANFLTHSKVADGLFLSIRYLLGPLKGGLGLAVIVVSTIFAATTGIVGASVVTMGMLSMPILLKCGYDHRLAAGMVCAGGSLGILIPPSIMLVTMGSYAEVSVGKLFFAALVPGLMLAAGYAIYIMVICHIHPDYGPAMSAEELAEMPMKQRIVGSLVNLIPPLLLILGVLGSIFSGIATPTEAAGVGALVALILAICYKQFSWKMLYDSVVDTAKTSAMVFIILFGAAAFTGIFMSLDGDVIITNFVLGLGVGKIGAMAIMMVLVFIMGMFIDWTGIIMIVLPIFLPIMDQFGVDRLWLVGVTAVILQTCFMTPPFGFALFYIKGIVPPEVKISEIYRGVIPFIIIVLIVTVLCIAFPQLVVGLPNLVAA
ncbi:MAG: TRAP transporter large permease subunit [Oscillibacter sp.]|nr:TRAP transporter large permease subunit [Oscillibacter sp.]MCI9002358.1 TRAP transporter large permease subunit [Oscillibacter sp.]